MKTPWRFLADLVSRKPSIGSTEPAGSQAPEMKTLEYHPENKQAVSTEVRGKPSVTDTVSASSEPTVESLSSGQTADANEKSSPRTEEAVVTPKTYDDPEMALAEIAHADKASSDARPGKSAVKPSKAKRAKAIKDNAARKRPEPAASETVELWRTAPKTFHEEMAELDLDVAGLRHQLARKLTQQNAQLRKMLQRFGD
ncbi:hypothetical protein [Rhizobium sp. 18055]|uniref:hypothetical protein n=1 Tax=Rhizobium sp. 18055 TaxID=2681403 RepID=UPI00135BAC81|nr:hypothetical protein [Rhizobium sp. 18055]